MTNVYPAETVSGVVTSFIPLTTVFTPTSSCTEQYRLNGYSLVAFDPGYGIDIDRNVICAPSAVSTWWEQGYFQHGDDVDHTAVSIGPLTCPDEWSTVASSVKDSSSTQLMCCPPGYYLENGVEGSVAGDCLSDVSSGMTLTFASTTPGQSETWSTATTTLTHSSTVGAIAIVGWNIRVERSTSSTVSFSSSSLSSSAPSISSTVSSLSMPLGSTLNPSSTTTQKITTTTPSQFSSTSRGTQSATGSNGPSGVTTSTAIGIGLGVGLGVVGVAALIVSTCLMRRRKRQGASTSIVQTKHDLSTALHPPTQNLIHELYPEGIRLELSADHARRAPAELYG